MAKSSKRKAGAKKGKKGSGEPVIKGKGKGGLKLKAGAEKRPKASGESGIKGKGKDGVK
jgi:hypothetical protein